MPDPLADVNQSCTPFSQLCQTRFSNQSDIGESEMKVRGDTRSDQRQTAGQIVALAVKVASGGGRGHQRVRPDRSRQNRGPVSEWLVAPPLNEVGAASRWPTSPIQPNQA